MEKSLEKPKKEDFIVEHLKKYEKIFSVLESEIDWRKRHCKGGTRAFIKVQKLVSKMRRELPKFVSSKTVKIRRGGINGLSVPLLISKELAQFLGLPTDTRLSRIEAFRALCVYIKRKEDDQRKEWFHLNDGSRNLQNPLNKKEIIPDDRLSRLLKYEQYKKDVSKGVIVNRKGKVVEDGSMYYWVIHKLLKNHFLPLEIEISA